MPLPLSGIVKQRAKLGNAARNRVYSMSTNTASPSGDDELRSRPQQSMLASQRAKQNSNSTEARKTGKSGGYFPLSYREAYSQWVSHICRD